MDSHNTSHRAEKPVTCSAKEKPVAHFNVKRTCNPPDVQEVLACWRKHSAWSICAGSSRRNTTPSKTNSQ